MHNVDFLTSFNKTELHVFSILALFSLPLNEIHQILSNVKLNLVRTTKSEHIEQVCT